MSAEASLAAALVASDVMEGVAPEYRDAVAREITKRAALDQDGKARRPVAEIIEELKSTEGWWSTSKPAEQAPADVPAKPTTLTERLVEEVKQDRAKKPQLPSGNPWVPGKINVTAQCLIERRDPAEAAKLKAEASA